jgi:hypothetical protein
MISRKRLEALLDEMTFGDTQGKVPIDKLMLRGFACVSDQSVFVYPDRPDRIAQEKLE